MQSDGRPHRTALNGHRHAGGDQRLPSGRSPATTPAKPPPASYQRLDGTSIAAAHVSGAVALLLSARPQLIGRPPEVKHLLIKTATDLKRVPWVQGSGLLDAFALLAEARKLVKPTRPAATQRAAARAWHPASQPTAGSTEKVRFAEAVTPDAPRAPGVVRKGGKRFIFGISYPGTHRKRISDVVFTLRRTAKLKREQILFDLFHEAEFARPISASTCPDCTRPSPSS